MEADEAVTVGHPKTGQDLLQILDLLSVPGPKVIIFIAAVLKL
jgi:hypothetical protein